MNNEFNSNAREVHYKVLGRIQGVFYRAAVKKSADKLGVSGFAQNEPDGSVVIVAQGPLDRLDDFRRAIWQGSPTSKVVKIIKKTSPIKHTLSEFLIK